MNPITSRFSAMHARWRMRAAICCALACSVFSAGNVDAEETGSTQSNVETIKNQTYHIMQDLDAVRAQVEMLVDDVSVLSQLEYWFGTVRTAIDSLDTYIRSGVDLRSDTLNVFKDYFDSVEGSMSSIRSQLNGVGTVTNFLGESSGPAFHSAIQNDVAAAIRSALGFPPNGFNGLVSSAPFMYPIPNAKTIGEWATEVFGGYGSYSAPTVPTNMLAYLQYILNALPPQDLGTSAATTNLLTTQNTTLERVAEYVAGVSNAVGTISNEYETDPTGSNDLPSEETPDALQVEKSVDTSSLEESVQQTFDGLEGLTPTGSSSVPEIMIRDTYRGEDAIRVRLDLSEISIATRVCKACWAILLAVGILGVVRSEWDYWTTLGGSAT